MTEEGPRQGIIFGAVADDDTGASDLAGMLADPDLRSDSLV
jgi:hypothetical protein